MIGETSFTTSTTRDFARITGTAVGAMGRKCMKGMCMGMWGMWGMCMGMTGAQGTEFCRCTIIPTEVRSRSPQVSETRLPGNADSALDLACCHGSVKSVRKRLSHRSGSF